MSAIDVTGGERLILPVQDDLEIRQLVVEDAPVYFETIDACRAHLGKFDNPTPERFATLEDTIEIIESQDSSFALFGVWNGDALTSSLSLCTTALRNSAYYEVGYWAAEQHSGRGYTSRAVEGFTDYVLHERGVRNVSAFVRQGNVASAGTAQKAGFRYLAAEHHRDGEYWLFGKFRETPEELKPVFADEVLEVQTLREQQRRSVAWVRLDGVNKAIINHGSETTYHVQTGDVTFIIDGEVAYLQEGESITAPKGRPYQDVGRATMLAVSEPAFDPTKVELVRPS